MKHFSGLTKNTPKHLQLDAGCFIRNYDVTQTYDQQKANIIGATAGGGSFSAVPTIRQIEIDGKKGAVKGFESLDEWVVTFTANVKELTAENLKLALCAGVSSPAENPSGYTKITGKNEIQDSDYEDNIAWIGRMSGTDDPIIIIVKNALATNGLSLSYSDKNEGVVPITITGHYDLDNLEAAPFEILYPSIT